ncbi:MAG: MarR family transcriptional regulator [Lactococcus sp.]|nr:MarR family transcriptional regulator [Lactococcus sp.]
MKKDLGKKVTYLNDLLIADQHKWGQTIGISSKDYNIFLTIEENPGCTQLFLAKKRRVERSLLTRIINKYSKMGYIERQENAHNKSAYSLYLTDQGQLITQKIRQRITELNHSLFEAYTETQYKILLDLLDIAIKQLED